jgi:tRNA threonylcarbamoyladenosine biosynthesis protein TsaB
METSGPHCSLALARNEHIYESEQVLHRRHNEMLLPMLDALFKTADTQPEDVDLVVFGCGPGSFTGVRIAAAACQALALVSDARVLPIDSSWTLAATAAHHLDQVTALVTCLPSRGQAFYLGGFEVVRNNAHVEALAVHADELTDELPTWLSDFVEAQNAQIVGVAPAWLTSVLQARFVPDLTPRARYMLPAATAAHNTGRSLAVEQALPRYIKGDSPWRKKTSKMVSKQIDGG